MIKEFERILKRISGGEHPKNSLKTVIETSTEGVDAVSNDYDAHEECDRGG